MSDLPFNFLSPGWYKIPDEQYFALPHLSRSMLMDFELSERYFERKHIKRELKDEGTSSMAMGSFVHDVIFDPNWGHKWAVLDFASRNSKDYRAAAAEERKAHKRVLLAHEYRDSQKITDALKSHPLASELLAMPGMIETTGIFKVGDSPCKFKPDLITDDVIIDLKTTADSSPKAFGYSAIKYGYIMQAAFYTIGAEQVDGKKRNFYCVVVDNDEPYEVRVYHIYDALIEKECERINRLVKEFERSKRDGVLWKNASAEPLWTPHSFFEGTF